jgi:3-isopropylmalate dehydratase small subunit
LDLGNQEIIIIECKSSKKEYSKFTSVIRQVKSYAQIYSRNGFKIKGIIIVSSCFTDDFIHECNTFYDLKVTLIEAQTLVNIYEEFKQSKLNVFPVTLFRHGLLQEEVIVKALKK